MSVGTLSPTPWQTFFNNSGLIVSGGKLFTYLAGTTTKVNTYTDVALTTPNANPIILDSAGRVPSGFYLTPGVSYKFVLSPSTDTDPPTSPIRTQDNIGTVPPFEQDVDVGGTAGENLTAGDAVYCSTGTGGDAARTAGRFYKADFSFAYRSTQPLITGFVTSTITTGNTGTFRLAGRMTGLSALTVGAVYWFSTTPGLLTSTSNYASGGRPVGIADSTTTLLTFPQATPHLVSTNVTPVTVASVAETDLMTFSVPAYTLNSNGMMLRATMLGINSGGGAGNRTYRCYFGTDVLALAVLAANGTEWRIEFEITRTAAATQLASVKRHLAAASSFDYASTFTRDTTAAQTLKLTVQGAGATDGGTQDMMLIELVTPRVIA